MGYVSGGFIFFEKNNADLPKMGAKNQSNPSWGDKVVYDTGLFQTMVMPRFVVRKFD
jgi:hypothetical protein